MRARYRLTDNKLQSNQYRTIGESIFTMHSKYAIFVATYTVICYPIAHYGFTRRRNVLRPGNNFRFHIIYRYIRNCHNFPQMFDRLISKYRQRILILSSFLEKNLYSIPVIKIGHEEKKLRVELKGHRTKMITDLCSRQSTKQWRSLLVSRTQFVMTALI